MWGIVVNRTRIEILKKLKMLPKIIMLQRFLEDVAEILRGCGNPTTLQKSGGALHCWGMGLYLDLFLKIWSFVINAGLPPSPVVAPFRRPGPWSGATKLGFEVATILVFSIYKYRLPLLRKSTHSQLPFFLSSSSLLYYFILIYNFSGFFGFLL